MKNTPIDLNTAADILDSFGLNLKDPLANHVWTTKDGRVFDVREMDDQHLDNTIKMLCRINEQRPESRFRQKIRLVWIERMIHEQAERALTGREVPPKPVDNLVSSSKKKRQIIR